MTKNKINIYTCSKGHKTITIDIDEGVTPFMLGCRHKGCKEFGLSCFYNCSQNLIPEWEWFKPKDLKEYSKGMKEHFEMGGLDIRKIENS